MEQKVQQEQSEVSRVLEEMNDLKKNFSERLAAQTEEIKKSRDLEIAAQKDNFEKVVEGKDGEISRLNAEVNSLRQSLSEANSEAERLRSSSESKPVEEEEKKPAKKK